MGTCFSTARQMHLATNNCANDSEFSGRQHLYWSSETCSANRSVNGILSRKNPFLNESICLSKQSVLSSARHYSILLQEILPVGRIILLLGHACGHVKLSLRKASFNDVDARKDYLLFSQKANTSWTGLKTPFPL